MKKNNSVYIILIFLLSGLLFSACKKDVNPTDFNTSPDMFKVYNVKGEFPFAQIKRPSGGYFLVYGESSNFQKDVSVAVTDDVGNVLHKTTFGGSKNEAIWCTQLDAVGNLYICGLTYSPELRIDKNAKITNTIDGYLAKLDKDGNLLWQRGYSDTTSYRKGINNDYFFNIYLINNKIYCIGATGNRYTPIANGATEFDGWLVTFDENGNLLKDRLLPFIKSGASLVNFSGSFGYDAIKLSNNDLIVWGRFVNYQSQGRNMDTTALLLRYNIANDTVLWTQYYRQTSQQGDINCGGLLANGNVAFFDSYWNSINIMDVGNGNVISTTVVNNSTASSTSNQYFMYLTVSPFNFNDNLYFLGYSSIGGTVANQKPFLAKLNSQGALVYNKIFNIPLGYFYWVCDNGNNNLQLMGGVNSFKTDNIKLFTLTVNDKGDVINK